MLKQKATVCRRCGKDIWLIENTDTGKWISCDRDPVHFNPCGHSNDIYITESGKQIAGCNAENGAAVGYRRHRKDCVR